MMCSYIWCTFRFMRFRFMPPHPYSSKKNSSNLCKSHDPPWPRQGGQKCTFTCRPSSRSIYRVSQKKGFLEFDITGVTTRGYASDIERSALCRSALCRAPCRALQSAWRRRHDTGGAMTPAEITGAGAVGGSAHFLDVKKCAEPPTFVGRRLAGHGILARL